MRQATGCADTRLCLRAGCRRSIVGSARIVRRWTPEIRADAVVRCASTASILPSAPDWKSQRTSVAVVHPKPGWVLRTHPSKRRNAVPRQLPRPVFRRGSDRQCRLETSTPWAEEVVRKKPPASTHGQAGPGHRLHCAQRKPEAPERRCVPPTALLGQRAAGRIGRLGRRWETIAVAVPRNQKLLRMRRAAERWAEPSSGKKSLQSPTPSVLRRG